MSLTILATQAIGVPSELPTASSPAVKNGQQTDPLEGVWQGYDGEWGHVSRQLTALAEAFPPDKFAWRPAPGVRSTSEVFMHIAWQTSTC